MSLRLGMNCGFTRWPLLALRCDRHFWGWQRVFSQACSCIVLTLYDPYCRSLTVDYLITWHLPVSPRSCVRIHVRELWFTKSMPQTEEEWVLQHISELKISTHSPLKCLTIKKYTLRLSDAFFFWDRILSPIRYTHCDNRFLRMINL